jgi:two-component system KDP operon response regulator KdpE
MASERNGAARRSVLIVEDDPAVARILRVCLRRAGFETTEVETGGEALQKMDEGPPDAVLLDLGLPDGLGGAMLHRLHEARDGYPAWLIVSALDEDEAVRRYGPLKGVFVPKPFDPWELVKKLEELLNRRSAHGRVDGHNPPPSQ